jgi:hypothetical protein
MTIEQFDRIKHTIKYCWGCENAPPATAYLIQAERDPSKGPSPYLIRASEFPVSSADGIHLRQRKLLEATGKDYGDAKRKLERYIAARHPELSPGAVRSYP